jgi:hypothetical protein
VTYGVALGAVGVIGLAACSGTAATTGISPITGILIRSDALVGARGCGRGPSQVFKYAAVVVDTNGAAITAGTYDCFADGSFQNLAIGNYTVEIFAFSQAAYDAQSPDILSAASSTSPDLPRLRRLAASATTSCRATQQQNIEVLAVCDPLRETSVELATDAFPTADGVGVTCKKEYLTVVAARPTLADGTTFAGTFGESTGQDGGAVQSDSGTQGDTREVECPTSILLRGVPGSATIAVEVDLVFASAVIAHTRCHATAAPGQTTKATCDPVERR